MAARGSRFTVLSPAQNPGQQHIRRPYEKPGFNQPGNVYYWYARALLATANVQMCGDESSGPKWCITRASRAGA